MGSCTECSTWVICILVDGAACLVEPTAPLVLADHLELVRQNGHVSTSQREANLVQYRSQGRVVREVGIH